MRGTAMKFYQNLFSVLLVAGLVSSSAFAQTDAAGGNKTPAGTPKKERKTTINFEDELVQGTTSKPELFYLFQRKNFNYKRLIKLRENFIPEMRNNTEDIQRVRGGN